MKRLLRRLSRTVAAAAEDGAGPAAARGHLRQKKKKKGKGASAVGAVPEGHVPVCVGEEGGPVERFAVRAELLGEPAFAALLRRAAQEYGYAHPGALRIPCPASEFRRLLLRLSTTTTTTPPLPPPPSARSAAPTLPPAAAILRRPRQDGEGFVCWC